MGVSSTMTTVLHNRKEYSLIGIRMLFAWFQQVINSWQALKKQVAGWMVSEATPKSVISQRQPCREERMMV